jgi:uncharacterized protein YecE (DUF72 family)
VRELRIGCSGWNYAHWRESFYPKGLPARRWLEHYAGVFDTVEVNTTFYRLPTEKAVAGWVEGSPPGFLFAVKSSRYLTHIKRLKGLADGVARFYERIAPLVASPKLGPVLWQLPPNFARDDERLASALAAVASLPPGRHCFEFRHPSWFADDVYALLREHGAALVIGDMPARDFQTHVLTADWTFVRFHYGSRGRAGNYSERELEAWAQRLDSWRQEVDVYAYFNNDWNTYAIRNGLWLQRRLGTTGPAPREVRSTPGG